MEFNNLEEMVVDIECGGTSSGDDTGNIDSALGKKRAEELLKKLSSRVLGFNGSSSEVEPHLISKGILGKIERLSIEKNPCGLQSQDLMLVAQKRHEKERPKIGKSKKPPRPPKGPNLDAVDMKLVKEICVLATKKRERIERMKALKKIKAAKSPPSSSSNLPALIITILFFLVIIFQGLCSRNSLPLILLGAPEPALINKGLMPNSYSPNSAEQLSGVDFRPQE